MDSKSPSVPLEDGLNVSEILRGSVLRINIDYDETTEETEKAKTKAPDFIGKPVKNLRELETTMTTVDENGLVKKKILEEGGGLPLSDEFTVSIAFSGYWEDQPQPFDVRSVTKPLVIDLKDHNLLPGLEIAVKSMLVGEASMFLFSYKVMYGELGLPPRIKPKEDCVFYIKLIKSIYTPKNGKINLKEPNMFERVHHEARMLMSSGIAMHKANNICMAASLFKKAVLILHKCRLADENEEKIQEKLLIKLYLNLAICYNDINQPLKACTACNELNRLDSLWNNHRALFQNAKALRMIGQFNAADKRLKRALKLCPDSERIKAEQNLLYSTRESLKSNKLCAYKFISEDTLHQEFKNEVDTLLKTFKANNNLCRLNLPPNLNIDELKYVKEACIRENLFLSNTQNLPKKSDNADVEEIKLFLDKDKNCSTDIFTETVREDKNSEINRLDELFTNVLAS